MENSKILALENQKRFYVVMEILVVFLLIPLSFAFFVKASPLFLILAGGLFSFWLLKKDDTFDIKNLYKFPDDKFEYIRLLLQVFIFTVILYLFMLNLLPDRMFYFLKKDFSTWIIIVLMYGLLAVYPQEILYRVLIFHRYGSIFKNNRVVVHLSALLFAFGHILYLHPVSILLSLVGGYLFSITYIRSGSIILVYIEHFLYGFLLYTIGLGEYFYSGFLR
ncbi:CPBP family intramembrane glutamic endopeptidase [Calditerrivibrio sp.]|uniref:CPBP family intramembrane glutamic endopeptidase n=1 Tax=Calditerrivibrio sp. TaxID=2792612 RepID=UPI003D10543C